MTASERVQRRFDALYIPEPNSGCWLWLGAAQGKGYGTMSIKDVTYQAHRVSWQLHRGQIPDGLRVLHRCDTRPCVNPDHLFLGTNADNTRDMLQKRRQVNNRKTHCKWGHEFTAENTIWVFRDGGQQRQCRACRELGSAAKASRAAAAEKKGTEPPSPNPRPVALKTHCVNGHEFTEANTGWRRNRPWRRKRRTCRACQNARANARNARRRAAK